MWCGNFGKHRHIEKDRLQFHLSNVVTINNLVNAFIDIVPLRVFTKMLLHLAYCLINCFYHIKHLMNNFPYVSHCFLPPPHNVILTSYTILYHMDIHYLFNQFPIVEIYVTINNTVVNVCIQLHTTVIRPISYISKIKVAQWKGRTF